jgi:hypothetical protein
MKTQLLFGTAMLAVTVLTAQAPPKTFPLSLAEISKYKYAVSGTEAQDPPAQGITSNTPKTVASPVVSSRQSKAAAYSWVRMTSSMNVLGVLLSESKQLSYNEDLDAICLIARRGPGYIASPNYTNITGAYTGAIVAFLSKDDGATWDSTLVWNNDVNWARYPQGGIWNPLGPPTNTNLSNAYVVVTGPITPNAGSWIGNYFASKSLSVFTNVADPQPGAQIFNDNSNPNPMFDELDMARMDFQVTDDGKIHVVGHIWNDFNSTSAATQVFRGIRFLKGSYNSGVFTWSNDSIMLHQSSVGTTVTTAGITSFPRVYGGVGNMAWSEDGQIGYAWFIGQRNNSTDNNMGLQPLVWKTTDGGTNWSEAPGINFNDTVKFAPVLKTVERAWDTSGTFQTALRIPHFGAGVSDRIGSIVDKNGNLHLTTTIGSTQWAMFPFVVAAQEFTNVVGDGQIYTWSHLGDNIPVIYDFVYSHTANDWNFCVIDTLRTEPPAIDPAAPNGYGYSYNPWPVANNLKQSCNARFQLSKSPDGAYIVYTWADSDPNFTQDAVRWNISPDLFLKFKPVDSAKVHPLKINLTGDPLTPAVYANARMHHASNKIKIMGVNTVTLTTKIVTTISFKIPLRVTNSTPLNSELPNTHHFLNAPLTFSYVTIIDDLKENGMSAAGSVLFPNPTGGETFLGTELDHSEDVSISVCNILGAQLRSQDVKGTAGHNEIKLDTEGLSRGVYLVNVRIGTGVATKKLIIE